MILVFSPNSVRHEKEVSATLLFFAAIGEALMPRLRIARAEKPSHPAERAYAVFSSSELAGGRPADWFVGRGGQYRMCIADPTVSRPHLEILFHLDKFFLINRSDNGCEIDGRRVTASDGPVPVTGNLSVKTGDVELRCTLLGDIEAADVSVDVVTPSVAVPSVDWWAAIESVARTDSIASQPREPSEVPSVEEWYSGPPQPEFIEPPVPPADSMDWTAGLTSGQIEPVAPSNAAERLANRDAGGIPEPRIKPVEAFATQAVCETQAVVVSILRAAGLREDIAQVHAKALPPEAIGSLLEQLLAGLISTLSTRRTMKNTLRVAHTELRIDGNNPLKHAAAPAEALLGLIQGERPGYLAAEPAIRSVFKDLADHELALLEGTEEALKHIIRLMSPEAIEHALGEASAKPSLVFRGNRDARAWTLYRARHAEIAGGNTAFANHFLPAFREAYDACLAKLRRRSVQGGHK